MNEKQNERSFGDKLSDFLDRNQVKIQLLTIYAGLIGIMLEGNYSDISLFLISFIDESFIVRPPYHMAHMIVSIFYNAVQK